jgi:Voltage-dependent anion channel
MATGIISNALYLEDHRAVSDALFAVNEIAFPWLILATLIRAFRFPRALWADLINPRLVFSFSPLSQRPTYSAFDSICGASGSCRFAGLRAVVGRALAVRARAVVLLHLPELRRAHLLQHRASRERRARGWLIAIVGTESLVIFGTQVAPALGTLSTAVFVLIHMLWGIGLALSGIFIVLFAHRIFFSHSSRTTSRRCCGSSWARPRSAQMPVRLCC